MNYETTKQLKQQLSYFFFEKEFNGPRFSVLALLLIPLVAYPLTLADYENTATVTSSPDQFETNLANNTSTVQVTPNAEIVIIKEVVNDNGGDLVVGDFNITTDAGTLVFDAGTTSGNTTTYTANKLFVVPGTYTLQESDITGYSEGSWSCTDGTLNNTAFDNGELVLTTGQSAVCTITNNDVAPQLTLVKNVINDNGGTVVASAFPIFIGTTAAITGTAQTVLANTPIDISEPPFAGYSQGTWDCSDAGGTSFLTGGPAISGSQVTLSPGDDVTCQITNNDIGPQVTLVKTLINDNGGDLIIADFDLTIDANPADSGVAQQVTANADFVISESLNAGYTSTTWACTDANGLAPAVTGNGDGTADLNLPPGANVSCLITNDDIAPTLTLVKNVINDNGGTAIASDFNLAISDPGAASPAISGDTYTVTANSPITIAEDDLIAYQEGQWVCTDANGQTAVADLPVSGSATGTVLTLKQGSAVVCEITNNDLGIDLSIVKVVNDAAPNIGETISFTLTVDNAGPDLATNVDVTDIVMPGFTYVPGSMSGGTTQDESNPASTGLVWNIASIPAGSPVTLTFDVIVNAP